jgi:PadR family transcriptional regulator AphA
MRLYEPSSLDQTVLALIIEQPRHGFALHKELDSDESLSSVMRVRRPLVYRSINSLLEAKFIRPSKVEPGDQGSARTVYTATASGKRANQQWLNEIVTHPRDARIELLSKFVLRSRQGLSNTALARRQQQAFSKIADEMKKTARQSTAGSPLVAQWRYETVNAMVRVLQSVK